jgi:hypothetical protein
MRDAKTILSSLPAALSRAPLFEFTARPLAFLLVMICITLFWHMLLWPLWCVKWFLRISCGCRSIFCAMLS